MLQSPSPISPAPSPGRLSSHVRAGKTLEPTGNWLIDRKQKSSARFNAVQHVHEQYENGISNELKKPVDDTGWYSFRDNYEGLQKDLETCNKTTYEIQDKVKQVKKKKSQFSVKLQEIANHYTQEWVLRIVRNFHVDLSSVMAKNYTECPEFLGKK